MQFGMPTLIENKSLFENIQLCKELGLNFIELNMNFPEYQLKELEKTSFFVEAAKKAWIYFTIHLDENLNITDFNELVSSAYIETTRRTIKIAKEMIALRDLYDRTKSPLIINMHMNHGIHITLPDKKVQLYERNTDLYMDMIKNFRVLCEEWIGDSDIQIAIENTDGFKEFEKTAIEHLLQSPKFGLTWDIGHSKSANEVDLPFILSHQNDLIHFHIHDGTVVPPKNHLTLGSGEIDILNRLNTAESCRCRCVLETKTIKALKESVNWLRQNGYLAS